MSATTDQLVIPAIENGTFYDQFPDDIDMNYTPKSEFAKAITFYANRADLSKGATEEEIFKFYQENN